MTKILCLGEAVVDWVRTNCGVELHRRLQPQRESVDGFFPEPGTPAANVAIALSRLRSESALLASVGEDDAGAWLKSCLSSEGVNIEGVVVHSSAPTLQAFAVVDDNGERNLVKITQGECADSKLLSSELDVALFATENVLYVGSNSLSTNPIAGATKHALALARRKNMLVVADANLRGFLWKSLEDCKRAVFEHLSGVDVLKVNLDEFELLTGSRDVRKANALRFELNVPVLLVTLGALGSFFSTPGGAGFVPAFAADVKDSSGAGDAFTAMVIAQVAAEKPDSGSLREWVRSSSASQWSRIVARANAAGALAVSRFGASSAMPTDAEVDEFIAASRKAG